MVGSSQGSSELSEQRVERETTDLPCLIFLCCFYLILCCLIGYCVYYGDVYRIINGYDNCGNVCGRDNVREKYACSGVNMTDKPFLLVRGASGIFVVSTKVNRKCVNNCSIDVNYHKFLNRCIPNKLDNVVNTYFSKTGLRNFFQEVSEDFELCWRELWYLCLLALAFSVGMLIFLRYLVGVAVWLVLIGVSVACLAGTTYMWILWKCTKISMDPYPEIIVPQVDLRKHYTYLAFAIIGTIITAIVFLVILVMRNRIELVIQLFKEAGKAISVMPLLLFLPIFTYIMLAFVASLWLYFSVWIASAGFIQESRSQFIYYHKDFWMYITRWYNLLGVLWMLQFVIGCQHMIIAGAVSKWYFTRNKNHLGTPICEGAFNLFRYHLGSVAFGCFIIAVLQFVRIILAMVQKCFKDKNGKCAQAAMQCCQCCLYCFESVLNYLNRNAFIEIAISGYSFCQAGQQAFKLLVSNALRVAAINSVGDFVLFLAKVLVVVCTVLIGLHILQKKEGIQHIWVPVLLAGIFAYLVSHCIVTVYEMAIDTIFLCFCEDCEENDGIIKPYYMSRSLMQFVENSEIALKAHDVRVARIASRRA